MNGSIEPASDPKVTMPTNAAATVTRGDRDRAPPCGSNRKDFCVRIAREETPQRNGVEKRSFQRVKHIDRIDRLSCRSPLATVVSRSCPISSRQPRGPQNVDCDC